MKRDRVASGAATIEGDAAPAAAMMDDAIAEEGEIIILSIRPAIISVLLWCIPELLLIALLGAGAALAAQASLVPWTIQDAVLIASGLMLIRLTGQAFDWTGRVFVLTNRRIITRGGVIRPWRHELPLRSLREVLKSRSRRERVAGIGTISFVGTDRTELAACWRMIRKPDHVRATIVEAWNRATR